MRHFCTYFDHRYLPRGLALYRSLKKHCSSFQLWVLCMDQACYDGLAALDLPEIKAVPLAELEAHDRGLAGTKQDRSLVEYYFTCTPAFTLFLLETQPEIDILTYVDADMFFFHDPEPIYEELGDRSIGIVAHRFPPALTDRNRYGIYNVGLLAFRYDDIAIRCLGWWRERCLEWCRDSVEDGRFADQGYLNDWPTRFEGVAVLNHRGINVAPWNLRTHSVYASSRGVLVDGQPLICFHFHGLKYAGKLMYDSGLAEYATTLSRPLSRYIYRPYIKVASSAARDIPWPASGNSGRLSLRVTNDEPDRKQSERGLEPTRYPKRVLRGILQRWTGLASGRYILAWSKGF